MVSTTHVNTNPVAFNESRIRHRSGIITLYGVFNIQSGGPGPSGLGYRTDNTLQGDSMIILKNENPLLSDDVETGQNFTGGILHIQPSTVHPEGYYSYPGLTYKHLIFDYDQEYYATTTPTIPENGILELRNGFTSNEININNNSTIIISNGYMGEYIDTESPANSSYSRPILNASTSKYNVIYNQNNSSYTTGRELLAFFNNNIITGSIDNLTINTTNPIYISNNIEVNNLIINSNCYLNQVNSGKISISNILDVNNSSILNLQDNLLTLTSKETKTARVDELDANSDILGKVFVQRFLKNNKRQWRLLTSPLKGNTNNTILYNWQNNGNYSSNPVGIDVFGPTGTMIFTYGGGRNAPITGINSIGNGLTTLTTQNYSYNVRGYNNLTSNWYNVTNTTTEILFSNEINKAFLVFCPYPLAKSRNLTTSFTGSTETTITSNGNLLTGNITYLNILADKFYLIGNPYASPIDFTQILAEPDNSGINKVWFIDPTVSTNGGYVMWEEGVGYSNAASIFKTNNASGPVFQSGEAFFVKATSATSSLTIKETHKTDGVTNTTLNRNANQTNTTNYELFRILLEKQSENNFINADGCVAAFYMGGNNEVDNADGSKLGNPGENIALVNATSLLSIEHRNTIENNDFLTLRISNATVGTNYKLKLYTENFEYDGYAYLQDLFLGTTAEIPLDGSVFEYEYQITENTASTGSRFKILFQNTALSNAEFTATDFMLYPNPVNENESFTIQFHSKANEVGSFDCKIYNALGQLIQNNHLNVVNGSITVPLTSSFKSGVYFVEIYNTQNNSKTTKSLIIE